MPREKRDHVTSEDIARVVSAMTGVPATRLVKADIDRLMKLEEILKARIIGQDPAVAEVAKAIRHFERLHIDETSEKKELRGELADVFIYLLDLSNHLGVDLEECFREKETINKTKSWKHGT